MENYNGEGMAVYSRRSAWHRLGTVVSRDMGVAEAMTTTNLDGWQVRVEYRQAQHPQRD